MERYVLRWVGHAALTFAAVFAAFSVVLLVGTATGRFEFAGPVGASATSAALFFAIWQFAHQNAVGRSRSALDVAITGVQRSYELLQPEGSNTRTAWVNASRLLARALAMSAYIEEADHKAEWELFREQWRIKFYHLFQRPAEYFFGRDTGPPGQKITTVDIENLVRASAIEKNHSVEGRSITKFSSSILPRDSLKHIYSFTEFEPSWKDPLPHDQDFDQWEMEDVWNREMIGFYTFLYGARNFRVYGGKVERLPPDQACLPD